MMIKAVFFDLDGTLLPLNEDKFAKLYFSLLSKKAQTLGYDQEKFLKILLSGTEAMYKNESENTNEEVFWNTFANYYGKDKLKDKPLFDKFYLNEFKLLKEACEKNDLAREIIDYCKKNLKYTLLSTNPLFPYNANLTRMGFVGLKESDFTYITSYENSNCCKPNPTQYRPAPEGAGKRTDCHVASLLAMTRKNSEPIPIKCEKLQHASCHHEDVENAVEPFALDGE